MPGGATRSDLWVRNASDETTTMSVIAHGTRSTMPTDVAPRDDFRVRVAGTRVSGTSDESCQVLTTGPLGPGERSRVPVSVALPSTSRNVSEDRSVTLSMRVHLVAGKAGDPCGGSGPGDGGDDGSDGSDPDEGGSGGDGTGGSDGDDGGATPPERPGRVDTDGGPGEAPAVTDLLLLALGVLGAVVSHAVRRRGRARRERPTG